EAARRELNALEALELRLDERLDARAADPFAGRADLDALELERARGDRLGRARLERGPADLEPLEPAQARRARERRDARVGEARVIASVENEPLEPLEPAR